MNVHFLRSCLYWFVVLFAGPLVARFTVIIWFFALLPFGVQFFGYILLDFLCSLPPLF